MLICPYWFFNINLSKLGKICQYQLHWLDLLKLTWWYRFINIDLWEIVDWGSLHSLLLHNSGFKERKICFSVKQSVRLIDPLLFTQFIQCYNLPSASILPTFECRLYTDYCLSSTICLFACLLPAFHLPINQLLMSTCQSSIVSLWAVYRPPVDCMMTIVAWKNTVTVPTDLVTCGCHHFGTTNRT